MAARKPNLLFALVAIATAACGERDAERFVLDGRTYSVPSEHLSSATREPHMFVRIKNPDKPYDLIYDSRGQGAQLGPGVPKLFSINDEDQSGVVYYSGSSDTIACRRAVEPKAGCGLRVSHDGVEWTILFPIARRAEGALFERDALSLLGHYAD